ncbi:ParB N-terminal domain-containing protein [Bradyrhizobium sp. URHD0069]|uniref:ParB N-terminal domain-containing protein n=1 Tax=Bradyrhizobium sp. URHD0069 TaxID=1380355 RepID=UPI000495508E|nr:ParB N-terminal domain-containing protein [Bradyrhizobium sp. URHD0069]
MGNPYHDPKNGEFTNAPGGTHAKNAKAHLNKLISEDFGVQVPLSQLRTERGANLAGWRGEKVPEFQPGGRKEALASRDAKIISGLRQILRSGKELDPIAVAQEGQSFRILDGHHRFVAYELEGRARIPAKLVK